MSGESENANQREIRMSGRRSKLDPANHDPISMDGFTKAVKEVLLKPMKAPPSENREPTKAELEQLYKLVRKNP